MPFVRSKYARPVYIGQRKFAHGGKGAELTHEELATLRATRNKAKDGGPGDCLVAELAFESGALELLVDGRVVTLAEYDDLRKIELEAAAKTGPGGSES